MLQNKNMIHIWIGPKPAPYKWMNTWKEKHPDWNYYVFDNKLLAETHFINRKHIDAYIKKGKYAGAADLIRYELLYNKGGFLPPADAICYHNTDELFTESDEYCYTVYESETKKPGFVSPIYACNPRNEFVKHIIHILNKLDPNQLGVPWKTTGNEFLKKQIAIVKPKIKIFPSHYFIPQHYIKGSQRYKGPDKIYADQMWGSTNNGLSKDYNEGV